MLFLRSQWAAASMAALALAGVTAPAIVTAGNALDILQDNVLATLDMSTGDRAIHPGSGVAYF